MQTNFFARTFIQNPRHTRQGTLLHVRLLTTTNNNTYVRIILLLISRTCLQLIILVRNDHVHAEKWRHESLAQEMIPLSYAASKRLSRRPRRLPMINCGQLNMPSWLRFTRNTSTLEYRYWKTIVPMGFSTAEKATARDFAERSKEKVGWDWFQLGCPDDTGY